MARRNARSVTEVLVIQAGSPRLLGTIDFTATSKTNAQATTPFNAASPALAGKTLLLQASQDCYILPVGTSTGTVSSSTGILVFANERTELTIEDTDPRTIVGELNFWLAAIRSTADGNLKVWELV